MQVTYKVMLSLNDRRSYNIWNFEEKKTSYLYVKELLLISE